MSCTCCSDSTVANCIQVLPQMMEYADAITMLLNESHNLVKAVSALVAVATADTKFVMYALTTMFLLTCLLSAALMQQDFVQLSAGVHDHAPVLSHPHFLDH